MYAMTDAARSTAGRRAIAAAGLVTAIAAAGGVLGWAVGNPFAGTVPPAVSNFEELLGHCLGAAAWLAWAWLALGFILEVLSGLPGLAGRMAGRAAGYLTPHVVRRLTHAVLGVSLLAGPLAAGSAMAAGASPTPASPTSAAISLDRPAAGPTAIAFTGPSSLDRPTATTAPVMPARPYVAPAPVSPAAAADPGPSALLSGNAHRASDDNGYVVRRGDALWDIAARHLGPHASAADVARAWPRWYAANRAVIGADPGVIHPGEILQPPTG